MRKMAVGFAVVLMMLFVFHSSERVFCATQRDQPDYDNQTDDEGQPDGIEEDQGQPESDVPPGYDQQEPDPPPGYDRPESRNPQGDDQPEPRQEYRDTRPGVHHAAHHGDLFKKISIGMTMRHVTDLIGPPTDTKQYMTGKNFIPFYMGTDTVRLEAIYRGEGRITFTGRPLRVYQIVNNPNEGGYNE